ncbi:penicillin-binding transpeptidase domain-containing protein [Effusibacillus pohliae]|uniref:penicillin-binding transpeptidase domain-containing protein n=1 Tax=Effusibacillus pohliae TaxID=232270 RepID=UPI0003636712|nr:penicillin-binding transpeptidase domain-containing protein [Effusibacillus pohliae]
MQYVSTIANGGKRMKPFVVKQIVSPDKQVIQKTEPQVLYTVSFSLQQLQNVREGMWQVTRGSSSQYWGLIAEKMFDICFQEPQKKNGREMNRFSCVQTGGVLQKPGAGGRRSFAASGELQGE